MQPRALGAKVSDEWTVSLCFLHHRSLHNSGAEETWWDVHGADPIAEAKRLWELSRKGTDNGQEPISIPSSPDGTNSGEGPTNGNVEGQAATARTYSDAV